MPRTDRPSSADSALNSLEHDWWNQNASTIARVWEMCPEVSRAVRSAYLARAREFLLNGRERATVLELGSGSGWVGQSIADARLRVIGTDFSESQVALARDRARGRGQAEFCRYEVATSDRWPDGARNADGALIHAFLHHLDQSEIHAVLHALRTRLRPGARIWFYEPSFLSSSASPQDAIARGMTRAVHALSAVLRLASRATGLRDEATARSFDTLQQRAVENDWYLSPKEVPFDYAQFTSALSASFTVRDSYWATIYMVGWAYECNLLRSAFARRVACATYLPIAAACDRFLTARAGRLGSALQAPNHGFAVWECEVRA